MFYSGKGGDNCWRPRECLSSCKSVGGQMVMLHYTLHSEIYVAGLLVYYILTGGQHVFGDSIYEIETNMASNCPKLKGVCPEAKHLILSMIAKEPRDRADINSVLRLDMILSLTSCLQLYSDVIQVRAGMTPPSPSAHSVYLSSDIPTSGLRKGSLRCWLPSVTSSWR